MDKELEKICNKALRKIYKKENRMEFLVFPGKYFKYMKKEEPVFTLNEDEKYVEFNEKYVKSASSMKEFSELIDYLEKNNYKTNLN